MNGYILSENAFNNLLVMMPRPREFNPSDALEKAMQVFWSQGYEATSLNDLTKVMGLSKSSLYETFGCKRDLFLQSLDYYRDNITARVRQALHLDAPANQIIASLLNRAVDRIIDEKGRRGCLLNNTAVELAMCDPEIARHCASGLTIMEDTMHQLILRGQQEGSINAVKNARALARFLTASINGVFVMGKANPDRAALTDIVDVALSTLNP